MNRISATAALFGIVALAGLIGATAQDKKEAPKDQAPKKEVVFSSSMDEAKYKEVLPGVSKIDIWGDADKGGHGSFTKFAPGQNNALHFHTNDIRIVVVKGAYIFKPETGDEKRVGAGQYLFIPGGVHHVSMGDAKDGAVFYEESTGKFDLVPVEQKKQ
jgi:quercetin dioxygenase-like cupin family protein